MSKKMKAVIARHDRYNRFRITRFKDPLGLDVYVLENQGRDEAIAIPRELFDKFREAVAKVCNRKNKTLVESDFSVHVFFRTQTRYTIAPKKSRDTEWHIQEHNPAARSTGSISVSFRAMPTLKSLLFSPKVRHGNDLLDRICTYHKLFQFSFQEESESITSDLIVRKDILSHVDKYLPGLGKQQNDTKLEGSKDNMSSAVFRLRESDTRFQTTFKSKLGERTAHPDYKVDYDTLFDSRKTKESAKSPKTADDRSKWTDNIKTAHSIALPIVAGEVKAFPGKPYRADFGVEDMATLRSSFLVDRDSDFFLGVEILDCVYKKGSGLKTFQFPLYYLPVSIEESGRRLTLYPKSDRIFLNHLAIANTVETFSSKRSDPLWPFFDTLMNQTFDVDGLLGRVMVMRRLPFSEEVFQKVREILIGFPGENGKGGLFGDLHIRGIECDLETVCLYKSPKPTSPTIWALDNDLDYIGRVSKNDPEQFYQSLLGNFLAPESGFRSLKDDSFSFPNWCPGPLPKSTRRLLNQLDNNDLVLLEGPPGTGKTYTIANLVIHAIAAGKRVLVVSDKQAAIQAVKERLEQHFESQNMEAPDAKRLSEAWQAAVRVVDNIPSVNTPLPDWVNQLREMLAIDRLRDMDWPELDSKIGTELQEIDDAIAEITESIDSTLKGVFQFRAKSAMSKEFAENSKEKTTEIQNAIAFIHRLNDGAQLEGLTVDLKTFVIDLIEKWEWLRDYETLVKSPLFAIPRTAREVKTQLDILHRALAFVVDLEQDMPGSYTKWSTLLSKSPSLDLARHLEAIWHATFQDNEGQMRRCVRYLATWIQHPLIPHVATLSDAIVTQIGLLKQFDKLNTDIWKQLRAIHYEATWEPKTGESITLDAFRFFKETSDNKIMSVMDRLQRVETLQTERNRLINRQLVGRLGAIARLLFLSKSRGGTNLHTKLLAILDDLATFASLEKGWPVLRDLQQALYKSFPIWICRKRAVSFLFPCIENSFDIIVVDEATQCRVDDALPLLFRARKLIAVGDERQTVLAKESAVDDYLFRDFDLDEHLRTTGARNIKGGGSHLFGLIKRIKQASVILDEHYRCAPDIIQYSNRYVYDNELNTMQWTMKDAPQTVVVDTSEFNAPKSTRQKSGKYRGVETEMVDRFLDYVAKTIAEIEKQTRTRVDVEKEVALCYFLLKNEVYIEDVKAAFLKKVNRGYDILHGAGAALQGKERNYIFYLWDITRTNMKAFKQGDDPTKRKGELNVLMSRPKRRAYHFLHRDFSSLSHSQCSIADFLWRRANNEPSLAKDSNNETAVSKYTMFHQVLFNTMLKKFFKHELPQSNRNYLDRNVQYTVSVGDTSKHVDIMILPRKRQRNKRLSLGLIDLDQFSLCTHPAEDVIDYYFQLKRAQPAIHPIFFASYELWDTTSPTYALVLQAILDIVKS
jgi:hypothetical protein